MSTWLGEPVGRPRSRSGGRPPRPASPGRPELSPSVGVVARRTAVRGVPGTSRPQMPERRWWPGTSHGRTRTRQRHVRSAEGPGVPAERQRRVDVHGRALGVQDPEPPGRRRGPGQRRTGVLRSEAVRATVRRSRSSGNPLRGVTPVAVGTVRQVAVTLTTCCRFGFPSTSCVCHSIGSFGSTISTVDRPKRFNRSVRM